MPRSKLTNHIVETPSHDLPRELLLSHKRVLQAGEKPELQRVLEQRRLEQHREQEQALQPPSDLQQELRKRQLKLLEYEREEIKRREDQENIPEFVRVKEKLRHIQATGAELP
ncbi:protein FAM107B [Megalops cyprinoides]|uniref:protein FAM107B n=1 Tax=Megalops cyprinoides TaxID=118141 RepID=UPI001864007C|nr:protein FAM107B [Megalops cyprinoides]